jgi:hypothetical protein
MNKPLHMKLFVHQHFSPSQGLALLPRVKKMFPQKSMNEIESLKKEHSCHIRMLKSPLNQDRYKILLMIVKPEQASAYEAICSSTLFPFTGACIVATGKENVSFSNSTLAFSLFPFNFVLYLYSFDIKEK